MTRSSAPTTHAPCPMSLNREGPVRRRGHVDAIATVIDAKFRSVTGDEHRSPAQRQAEALADVCGYVLDHADAPECGGRRPHLNVQLAA